MKFRRIAQAHKPAYRVIGRVVREREHGYVDLTEVTYNILQKRTPILLGLLHVWKEIDREIVPDHALISQGCFGDTGGWASRFAEHIRPRTGEQPAAC